MHSNITDFVSDVSDSIYGNWTRVKSIVKSRYPGLTEPYLSAIKGDAKKLHEALTEICGVAPENAEDDIRRLAHKADHFESAPSIFGEIQKYWSDLSTEDLGVISGRRSNLVSLIVRRYGLSRHHGWMQVNSFFARGRD